PPSGAGKTNTLFSPQPPEPTRASGAVKSLFSRPGTAVITAPPRETHMRRRDKTNVISYRVQPELRARIERRAALEGLTEAALTRRAVAHYLGTPATRPFPWNLERSSTAWSSAVGS